MKMNLLILSLLFGVILSSVKGYEISTLWCYRCVSTHPGCGQSFNWLWYWSQACPERGDKCVKIIERKGGDEVITRDCLSSLFHRTDIPADHYEGCRPAAKDVHLANYVNNTIKELDVKREYYDSTQFCFCYFDNRCNSAHSLNAAPYLSILLACFSVGAFYYGR